MLRIRKKRGDGTGEMGGQDSFLDIVSNIVGILIILVMVAGIRAQQSVDRPDQAAVAEQQNTTLPELPEQTTPIQAEPAVVYADEKSIAEFEQKCSEYENHSNRVTQLNESIENLNEQTFALNQSIDDRKEEYSELISLLASAKLGIELLAEEKDLATKEQIELKRQIGEIETKLEQMDRTKKWLQTNRPQATVLENIPTPISKTVEEKEAHFRLLGGKIVYVPLNEQLEKLYLEVARNKNQLFKQKTTTGQMGPLGDFRMEYTIICYDVTMRDSYGAGLGSRIELDYAEMIPVSNSIGQPLKEALSSPNSPLLNRLKMLRQDQYTITVWVYPDSFDEFRELKQFLYKRGYRVAARPKEFGQPISGSSRGTKSSSQ